MIASTVYGVILNDREEQTRLADAFAAPPYEAPPQAPVVYIKPRSCLAPPDVSIVLSPDLPEVELAATISLLFGRDLSRGDESDAAEAIAAACLAIDVSEPHADYYRPAISQRCRDGFLPLGRFGAVPTGAGLAISTRIDGVEVHRWSLDRLVRPAMQLAAELSGFMTFAAGDLLLVGLPGDAPRAGPGARISVAAAGLPTLETAIAVTVPV